MKKKLLFIVFALLLSVGMVAGADYCTDNNDPTSATSTLTSVNAPTYKSVNLGTDQKWYNLTTFTIDAQHKFNFSETATIVNGSTIVLDWKYVDTGEILVTNTSGTALSTGNYSVTYDGTNITWTLDDLSWNNTGVIVYYNRTLNTTENLVQWSGVANTKPYLMNSDSEYGGSPSFTVYDTKMNGQDWDLTYFYTTRTCNARDSCEATQATIYVAFGLIALFGVVGAAMLLISVFSGQQSAGFMGMSVALIGLAVILFIGYIVIFYVVV